MIEERKLHPRNLRRYELRFLALPVSLLLITNLFLYLLSLHGLTIIAEGGEGGAKSTKGPWAWFPFNPPHKSCCKSKQLITKLTIEKKKVVRDRVLG